MYVRTVSITLAALLLAALAPAAPAAALGGAGVGTFAFDSCPFPDVVTFVMLDNGDGSFSFLVTDTGLGPDPCTWFQADLLQGGGSPSIGFHGPHVFSPPWSSGPGGTFSASNVKIVFPASSGIGLGGGYTLTGSAQGVFV